MQLLQKAPLYFVILKWFFKTGSNLDTPIRKDMSSSNIVSTFAFSENVLTKMKAGCVVYYLINEIVVTTISK